MSIVAVQVLVRLCNHISPAEELARKDDLSLLFSAITSWCPLSNVPWRKSAAEVLVTLSRHGLTHTVVKYIHGTDLTFFVMYTRICFGRLVFGPFLAKITNWKLSPLTY